MSDTDASFQKNLNLVVVVVVAVVEAVVVEETKPLHPGKIVVRLPDISRNV